MGRTRADQLEGWPRHTLRRHNCNAFFHRTCKIWGAGAANGIGNSAPWDRPGQFAGISCPGWQSNPGLAEPHFVYRD